jgi:hypothetical protein
MVLDARIDCFSATIREEAGEPAMKHIPSDVFAWLLAAAVAACLASHNLYGQVPVGVPHSGGSNTASSPRRGPQPDPANVWRDAAMRGLSYNESLALYRLRQSSTVPTPLHPRFQAGAGAGVYTPARAGAQSFVPGYPSNVYSQRVGKPFENARPAPTAFERYWPLMLEGRQDPKTGVIIWYMP